MLVACLSELCCGGGSAYIMFASGFYDLGWGGDEKKKSPLVTAFMLRGRSNATPLRGFRLRMVGVDQSARGACVWRI